jgi:hypothetical protein
MCADFDSGRTVPCYLISDTLCHHPGPPVPGTLQGSPRARHGLQECRRDEHARCAHSIRWRKQLSKVKYQLCTAVTNWFCLKSQLSGRLFAGGEHITALGCWSTILVLLVVKVKAHKSAWKYQKQELCGFDDCVDSERRFTTSHSWDTISYLRVQLLIVI